MAEDLRQLPGVPRVATGVVRFGDDWPGIFIRGDEAIAMADRLSMLDRGQPACVIDEVVTFLRSCRVNGGI